MEDKFEHKSKSWDMSSRRVQNAKGIADVILNNIDMEPTYKILDVGAGTGLLGYFISAKVKEITALDSSASMLAELQSKVSQFDCPVSIVKSSLAEYECQECFDGIISSMTMHHIEDIGALFHKLYGMLQEKGFIAIADLGSEDGTFHDDNDGVYHFGFDFENLKEMAKAAGFREISAEKAHSIEKPHGNFDVFVLMAKK
jgi:cyclopropane fatty-acyl-phospholipid synthase-like methyltransferase